MKTFESLYARNSSGQINEWSIEVTGDNHNWAGAIIRISEGLIHGKKTETNNRILKGKNVGKMNATTPYEQACSQAKSRWEKKKKQGYKSLEDLGIIILLPNLFTYEGEEYSSEDNLFLTECIDKALPRVRTDANDLSKPMKAQPYYKFTTLKDENGKVVKDEKGKPKKVKTDIPLIKFPCFGQPKFNGFRVIARWEKIKTGEGLFTEEIEKVVFRSKEGLRYDILEHIEKDFTKEMFFLPGMTIEGGKETDVDLEVAYDGEMYIHGEILSEISSAIRKRNGKTEKLQFYIFDLAIENIKQDRRITIMKQIDRSRPFQLNNVHFVTTENVIHHNQALELTNQWIREGYEGGIFRDGKAFYQFGGRPQTMVKLKLSQDKEFEIIDVVSGDNAPELGVFVCRAENGKTFKCNPEGTVEKKKEYLREKATLIGKQLTVRFFERTKDDLPFHAVGVVVRDYE